MDEAKEMLTEVLAWPLLYPELMGGLPMKQPAGALLYGPSGCGKTLLAQVSAAKLALMHASVADESRLTQWGLNGTSLVFDFIFVTLMDYERPGREFYLPSLSTTLSVCSVLRSFTFASLYYPSDTCCHISPPPPPPLSLSH